MSSPAREQFSSGDSVVVVMGPTGTGKSTFIECATRQDGKTVGHGLKSKTSKVRLVRTTHPNDDHPVVFVDTPGFDDTTKSDLEVLSMIADCLLKAYNSNVNLSTIIYLHRISDNRMSRSAMGNIRRFSNLCGQKLMPNVVIVTTMWSLVSAEIGTKREGDLKKDVWNYMLEDGCKTKRFTDTYESAWDIVGNITPRHSELPSIVREMANGQSIPETEAGTNCIDMTPSKEVQGLLRKIRRSFLKWLRWSG